MLEKSANPETVYGVTGEHKHTHNTSQNRPSPEVSNRRQLISSLCRHFYTKPCKQRQTDR